MSRIHVTNENLDAVIFELECHGVFAFDTETTGLNPYKGHRLFSIIMSTYKDDFYFNFNDQPDHLGNKAPEETILPRKAMKKLRNIFNNPENTIYVHNAKFDMHFINVENLDIRWGANIVCTQAMSRLVHNQLGSYSLANLGALIGHEKDDTVEKYISKNKLYTDIDVGKKKPKRDKHYDLVPFDIISNYGMQDGRVVFELGQYVNIRLQELGKEQLEMGLPDLQQVVLNEIQLTKTLFKMEAKGVKIDRKYCEEAYGYEMDQFNEACNKFYAFTDGIEFQDAAACFKEAFKKLGLTPNKTAKGNDSFSADNLPDNDLTDIILTARKHYKRAGTYFKNFLDMADKNDIIHCSFNQAGTATGRLSASSPNLQNVPKRGEDKSKYPVRRAFIPREDHKFFMLDFDQQEYRQLLDIADEQVMIDDILNNGTDVHTATGNLCSIPRFDAKQVNFAQVYGQGLGALSESLGKTMNETRTIRNTYFSKLRRVKALINGITKVSESRGWIVNWYGRRLICPNRGLAYKMTNHYIQGGCGDVCKIAMNTIDPITDENAYMLIQIHDEVLYEVKDGYEKVVKEFNNLMERAYPYKKLPLTVGTEFSLTDWHNKEDYNV